MNKTTLLSILAVTLLSSSCATIISGSKQKVSFISTPTGATIFINDIEVGQTPFQTKLKRKHEQHIAIKMDGYQTFETKLTKKFNAWYIGNAMVGGFIGFIIDPITGAMYTLSPKLIDAQLINGTQVSSNDENISIRIAMEIDPTWQKVGQLVKQ